MINCKICNPSIREEAYCSQHSTSGMVYENKTTMKPNKKEQGGWEKEFDKEFTPYGILELHDPITLIPPAENGSNAPQYTTGAELIKSFISQLLLKEYRNGYNACLRDFKIENKYGEKSL